MVRARNAAIIADTRSGVGIAAKFANGTAGAAFAGRISRARPQFGRSRRAPFPSCGVLRCVRPRRRDKISYGVLFRYPTQLPGRKRAITQ